MTHHHYPFGLIGNCSFSALVDREANIKWLCWPRFDSSFIFGSLLDETHGGHFSIRPENKTFFTQQNYVENTNILVTRFESTEGVFEVTDFAPRFRQYERYHKPLMVFRKVRRISGNPRLQVSCRPRGGYGKIEPQTALGSNHIRYMGLEEPLRLTTNASLTLVQQERPFTLDEDIYFVLSWGIPLEGPLESTVEDFLSRTKQYWQRWVERCALPRLYQKEVIRSALALKLHQYEDTGAIVASCTTSLPETAGHGRNWDYRYCWLRDTYYTLSALHSLGHFEEMERYALFIENLNLDTLSSLQPVYRIDGTADIAESELPLEGFQGEKPVRIGNEAAKQIQHDAYGQIILALYALCTDERIVERRLKPGRVLSRLIRYIEQTMQEPDNGVWEFRGKKDVHSYTLLFHWAGSAASRKIAEMIGDKELFQRADACVKTATALLEKCFSEKKQAYGQAVGSNELDASLLQMITLGYFHDKPKDKAIAHLRALQKELQIKPGFFLRYNHTDDFGKQATAFLVCSYWFIEALVHLGFADEARELFDSVLKAQNHLGLISEGFDVVDGAQRGNFPQTYSHVGLINCAFALDRASEKPFFL